MFELGWIEIGLIGVIALVVLGPERLPKAARFAGLWVRKARAQWFNVKAELERELAADELKAALREQRDGFESAARQVNEDLQALQREADPGTAVESAAHRPPSKTPDDGELPHPAAPESAALPPPWVLEDELSPPADPPPTPPARDRG